MPLLNSIGLTENNLSELFNCETTLLNKEDTKVEPRPGQVIYSTSHN